MRDGLFDPFRRRLDVQGALRPYLQQPDPSLQPPVAEFPMQTPGAAFRGEVARVRAPQQPPAVQPPVELNGQLQTGEPMPMQGSMPAEPIMEQPAVGGPNPYATPPAPARSGGVPAMPQQPGGQMSADELNRMVLALLQGTGGNSEQEQMLRQQMAMGAPQQGAIY